MIRAYRKVDETEHSVTYEYNPICSYWLYSTVLISGIGYAFEIDLLLYFGMASLALYVAVVYFPALVDARKIKAAIREKEGAISGSRWSFSNPLRIRVNTKPAAE